MSCYIVSFDVKLESTRNDVHERLKSFGSYCPINKSCWAITSEKKAAEIRDYVKVAVKSGDRLFVIRSGTEAAWLNAYGDKHSEWLKKHL